jgi:3-phenylpropionate/cinnamic acid dioxygenase small subunit
MSRAPAPEESIRRTLARYCHLCDDGRFEEWAQLFTADTRFHVMGRTHGGRDAARAFIEAGQPPERRGKHVVANSLVVVDDDGTTARAWSDYVFLDRAGVVTNQGRYHDELVRGDDGVWRFALREIVFQGARPELTGQPPG